MRVLTSVLLLALLLVATQAYIGVNTPSSKVCTVGSTAAHDNGHCCPLQQLRTPLSLLYTRSPPFSNQYINNMMALFPEGSSPYAGFTASNVYLQCDEPEGCNIELTFITEGAGHRNVFGYFYWDPVTSNIDKNVAGAPDASGLFPLFPDTSMAGSAGCLQANDSTNFTMLGNRILGFWVKANGADYTQLGRTSNVDIWYSIVDYDKPGGLRNTDGYDTVLSQQTGIPDIPTRHFGWVKYAGLDEIVFGFEDLHGLGDRDYNDAMFALRIGSAKAPDIKEYNQTTGTVEECLEFNPYDYADYIYSPDCVPHIPLDPTVGQGSKSCSASYYIPDGWEVAGVDSLFTRAAGTFSQPWWGTNCLLGAGSGGQIAQTGRNANGETCSAIPGGVTHQNGKTCYAIKCDAQILIRATTPLPDCSRIEYGYDCNPDGVSTHYTSALEPGVTVAELYQSTSPYSLDVIVPVPNRIQILYVFDVWNTENTDMSYVQRSTYGTLNSRAVVVSAGWGMASSHSANSGSNTWQQQASFTYNDVDLKFSSTISKNNGASNVLFSLHRALSTTTWSDSNALRVVVVVSKSTSFMAQRADGSSTDISTRISNLLASTNTRVLFVAPTNSVSNGWATSLAGISPMARTVTTFPGSRTDVAWTTVVYNAALNLLATRAVSTDDTTGVVAVPASVSIPFPTGTRPTLQTINVPVPTTLTLRAAQRPPLTRTVRLGDTGRTAAVRVHWNVAPVASPVTFTGAEYVQGTVNIVNNIIDKNRDANYNTFTIELLSVTKNGSPLASLGTDFEVLRAQGGAASGTAVALATRYNLYDLVVRTRSGFYGTYVFQYRLHDGCLYSDSTITLNIAFVNDRPWNSDFSIDVWAGTQYRFNVDFLPPSGARIGDQETPAAQLQAAFVDVAALNFGVLEVNNAGTWTSAVANTYALQSNYRFRLNSDISLALGATAQFRYRVRDLNTPDAGISDIRTITLVLVANPNPPPTLSVTPTSVSSRQTVATSFQVTIGDNSGRASLLFEPVGDMRWTEHVRLRPVSAVDPRDYSVLNSVVANTVLLNDLDLQGAQRVFDFDWTPAASAPFGQTYRFTLRARDDEGLLSAPVQVTLTVPANQPPTHVSTVPASPAVDETASSTSVEVTLTFTDPNEIHRTSLDLAVVTLPQSGTLTLLKTSVCGTGCAVTAGSWFRVSHGTAGTTNTQYTFAYSPSRYFHGSDQFVVRARDAASATSEDITVQIIVNNINFPPVSSDQTFVVNADTELPIRLSASDPDTEDHITLVILTLPESGLKYNNVPVEVNDEFTLPSNTPTFQFAFLSGRNEDHDESFTFRVMDDKSLQSPVYTATIRVISVWENRPPVADNTTVSLDEDTEVWFRLDDLTSDLDSPDYENIAQFAIVVRSLPAHGTLYDSAGAAVAVDATLPRVSDSEGVNQVRLRYVPDADYFGADQVTYTVTDTYGAESYLGVVDIDVLPVNDPPTITVTPTSAEVGRTDSADFVVTVSDIDSPEVTVRLVAHSVDTDLSTLSAAAPAWTLTAETVDGAAVATLVLASTDTVTLSWSPSVTLPDGWTGQFTLDAVDSDGLASQESRTQTLSVIPNLPPTVVNEGQYDLVEDEDDYTELAVTLIGTDPDPYHAETLTFVITSLPSLPLAIAGVPVTEDDLPYTYAGTAGTGTTTAAATVGAVLDYFGTTAFDFYVRDALGAVSEPQRVTIEILPVNDAPTTADQHIVLREDDCFQPAVCAVYVDRASVPHWTVTAHDVDGDNLTLYLDRYAQRGFFYYRTPEGSLVTITDINQGFDSEVRLWEFFYVPHANQHSDCTDPTDPETCDTYETIGFRVSDGIAETSGDLTVVVLPVNDPPSGRDLNIETREDESVYIRLPALDLDDEVSTLTATFLGTVSWARGSYATLDGTPLAPGDAVPYGPYGDGLEGHVVVFTPAPNDFSNPLGTPVAQFYYRLADPHGAQSLQHTVSVYVLPVADPIEYTGATEVHMLEDTSLPFSVATRGVHWTSADFGVASFTVTAVTDRGTFEVCNFGACEPLPELPATFDTTRSLRFTPLPDEFGSEYAVLEFTLTLLPEGVVVLDPTARTEVNVTFVIHVDPVNDPPVLVPHFPLRPAATVFDEDTEGMLWFTATDIDSPLESLYASIVSLESNIDVALYVCSADSVYANKTALDWVHDDCVNASLIASSGAVPKSGDALWVISVVPAADVNGKTAFSFYVADDYDAPSDVVTALIEIRPINDAPLIGAQIVRGDSLATNLLGDVLGFQLTALSDIDFLFKEVVVTITEVSGFGTFVLEGFNETAVVGARTTIVNTPCWFEDNHTISCQAKIRAVPSWIALVRYLFADERAAGAQRQFRLTVNDLNNEDYRAGQNLDASVLLFADPLVVGTVIEPAPQVDLPLITGAAIGGLLFGVAIAVAAFFLLRRRSGKMVDKYFDQFALDMDGSVEMSPLYEGASKGGESALYKGASV